MPTVVRELRWRSELRANNELQFQLRNLRLDLAGATRFEVLDGKSGAPLGTFSRNSPRTTEDADAFAKAMMLRAAIDIWTSFPKAAAPIEARPRYTLVACRETTELARIEVYAGVVHIGELWLAAGTDPVKEVEQALGLGSGDPK